MNNENLKPQPTRTKSEQREIAQKGGIASGVARRENARLRAMVTQALEAVNTQTGMTLKETAVLAMVQQAAAGDLKAFEMVMQLTGEWNTEYTSPNAWSEE